MVDNDGGFLHIIAPSLTVVNSLTKKNEPQGESSDNHLVSRKDLINAHL